MATLSANHRAQLMTTLMTVITEDAAKALHMQRSSQQTSPHDFISGFLTGNH